MCGHGGGPCRPHPRHAQRHPHAGRAGRPGRRRPPHRPRLHPARAARPHSDGDADRPRPASPDTPDALHVGHHRPTQGRHHRPVGRTHRAAGLRGRGGRLAIRRRRPAHGLLADVPHRVRPLRQHHAAGGRVAGHPQPLPRRHGHRHAAPPPADDGVPRPHAPAPHTAGPRTRSRRALRLAPPPRPCRGAVSRHGQARHHGTRPARRRLGVLRLHRGPVLGVRTGGLARASRHRRPGPSRPATPHRGRSTRRRRRRRRHHLVRHARVRPFQLLGEPRGHGRRLERRRLHRRRPRPARYRRLPLPDRTAPRPHNQRGRQRVSRRGRERPGRRGRHRRGGRLRGARRAVGPEGLRRLRDRRPHLPVGGSAEEALRAAAASRLAPYKRPKSYFATTDLPHTATGKLIRRAVPEHLGLPG